MALGGRILIEFESGGEILLQPLGPFRHQLRQVKLCLDIALQRRLAEPAGGLGDIARDSSPPLVGQAYLELRVDVAHLGELHLLVERKLLEGLSRDGAQHAKCKAEREEDGQAHRVL